MLAIVDTGADFSVFPAEVAKAACLGTSGLLTDWTD